MAALLQTLLTLLLVKTQVYLLSPNTCVLAVVLTLLLVKSQVYLLSPFAVTRAPATAGLGALIGPASLFFSHFDTEMEVEGALPAHFLKALLRLC